MVIKLYWCKIHIHDWNSSSYIFVFPSVLSLLFLHVTCATEYVRRVLNFLNNVFIKWTTLKFFLFLYLGKLNTLWNSIFYECCRYHSISFKKVAWKGESVSYSIVSDSLQTSWTIALRAPLSLKISWQEYWSGSCLPSLEDLPHPGIEPGLLPCRQIFYGLSYQGSPMSGLRLYHHHPHHSLKAL